jgi:hypothetical protein
MRNFKKSIPQPPYKRVSIKGHLDRLSDPDIIDKVFSNMHLAPKATGTLHDRYKAISKAVTAQKRVRDIMPVPYIEMASKRIWKLLEFKCNKLLHYCETITFQNNSGYTFDVDDEFIRDSLSYGEFINYYKVVATKEVQWIQNQIKGKDIKVRWFQTSGALMCGFDPCKNEIFKNAINDVKPNQNPVLIDYGRTLLHYFKLVDRYRKYATDEHIITDVIVVNNSGNQAIKIDYKVKKINNAIVLSLESITPTLHEGSLRATSFISPSRFLRLAEKIGINHDFGIVIQPPPVIPSPPVMPSMISLPTLVGSESIIDTYLKSVNAYKIALDDHYKKVKEWKAIVTSN